MSPLLWPLSYPATPVFPGWFVVVALRPGAYREPLRAITLGKRRPAVTRGTAAILATTPGNVRPPASDPAELASGNDVEIRGTPHHHDRLRVVRVELTPCVEHGLTERRASAERRRAPPSVIKS